MVRQRGQHHGDLRPALVAAALEILGEADARTLTLRAVARGADVSPAAPYHHFEDKEALLSAVALDGFLRLGEVQDRVRARTPLRRIEALTRAYIRFALDQPAHYAVMTQSLGAAGRLHRRGDHTQELEQAARRTFDRLVAAAGATRADLPDEEVRRRALQVWVQAQGTVAVIDVAGGIDDSFDPDSVVAGAAAAARAIVSA